MRRTPHTAAAVGGAIAASTVLLFGVLIPNSFFSGSSEAPPTDAAASPAAPLLKATPQQGAQPDALSPEERAQLLKRAAERGADTADRLELGTKEKLVPVDVVRDTDGTVHTRYQRTWDGLPVLGGDLVVHTLPAGELTVTLNTDAAIEVPTTTPKITTAAARGTAVRAAESVAAGEPAEAKSTRKVIWAGSGEPVLAWETVVEGVQETGIPSRLHVITDAVSGKQLQQYEAVHSGIGNSQYSGEVTLDTTRSGSRYELTDSVRGGHRTYDLEHETTGTGTLLTDDDDVWGTGSATDRQTAAVDAAYGAQMTWDYYEQVHGRLGIRGDGSAVYSQVHYGTNIVNAFWDDRCFCMSYGDGENGERPLTQLDVAGHEMTHGITAVTAGLIYARESGGLNEATSDILSTAMEFHTGNAEDPGDYLIGEAIDAFGDGEPLRYMDQPSKDGVSEDYWHDQLARVDVHFSSGPANHFFYLLSEGSGTKTIDGVTYRSPTIDGEPVTGIGRDNAARIWYRALTTYFTSGTGYHGARDGTLRAAADLFGTGTDAHRAVMDAWAAVGVGLGSEAGGPGRTFENATRIAIPDNGPAITSSVTVGGIEGDAPGVIGVGVDIDHSFRGDLRIDLVAPSGTTYRVKSESNDLNNNVKATYRVNISGESAGGTWTLRVQDRANYDTGHLNSWTLIL